MAPLFLLAVFVGQWVAAVILLIFFCRLAVEYVRVVGVERPYAIFLYALIPITFTVAAITPSLYFALPAGAILLLTLVPLLTGRVENLYDQLSFAGRGYLYLVWSTRTSHQLCRRCFYTSIVSPRALHPYVLLAHHERIQG